MDGSLPDPMRFFSMGLAIGSILVLLLRHVLALADDRRRPPANGPG